MPSALSLQWPLLAWMLLCGAVGLVLWNRFFRPRIEARWAAILILLALAPVLPSLRQGFVYGPFDTNANLLPWAAKADLGYRPRVVKLNDITLLCAPWQVAARRQMLEGRVPFLNPHAGAGQPLLGDAQSAPFSLVNLASIPFDPVRSQALRAFLRSLLALAGAFLAARQLGCRPAFALLAAAAYGYGGSPAVWRLFQHGEVMAFWPWAFLASEQVLVEPRDLRSRVLFGLSLAAIILAGHPETGAAACIALAGRWLFALLRGRRREVGILMTASLLAAAGTSFFILPVAATIPHSLKFNRERGAQHGPGEDRRQRQPGRRHHRQHGGPGPLRHAAAGGGAGAGADPVAGRGLGGPGRPGPGTRWTFFQRCPPRAPPLPRPPGRRGLRRPPRSWRNPGEDLLPPPDFRLRRALLRLPRRLRRGPAGRPGPGILGRRAAGPPSALRNARRRDPHGHRRPPRASPGPPLVERARWSLPQIAAESFQHAVIAVLAALGVLVVLFLRRHPTAAGLLAAALAAGQLGDAFGGYYPTIPNALAFPPVPLLDRLAREPGPFRILGTRAVFMPNSAVVYGLADVRTHDPMESARYVDWLRDVLDVDITTYKKQYRMPKRAHVPYLRLLGTRFLLASPYHRLEYPWQDRGLFRETRLWELPGEPRWAFFPETVVPANSAAQAREILLAARRPFKVASLEIPGSDTPTANGPARVLRAHVESDRLRIETEVEKDSWMVLSQAAIPGWRAKADGRAIPTAIADGTLLAVRVPAYARGDSPLPACLMARGNGAFSGRMAHRRPASVAIPPSDAASRDMTQRGRICCNLSGQCRNVPGYDATSRDMTQRPLGLRHTGPRCVISSGYDAMSRDMAQHSKV